MEVDVQQLSPRGDEVPAQVGSRAWSPRKQLAVPQQASNSHGIACPRWTSPQVQHCHTINYKLQYFDMGHMTANIKTPPRTIAHLAVPSSAPRQQNLTALHIHVDTRSAAGGTSHLTVLTGITLTVPAE